MPEKHVITIQPPFDGSCIYLCCSCSDEPIAKVGFDDAPASLVEVNEIAHAHIEKAEAVDENGCPAALHAGVDCPGDACRYVTAGRLEPTAYSTLVDLLYRSKIAWGEPARQRPERLDIAPYAAPNEG